MHPFLKDTVALVTGASDGLGAATARLLARAGASVVLTARRPDRLAQLGEIISGNGGTAHPVAADLASDDSVAALVASALHRFGRLDFVLNIGGSAEGIGAPLWQVSAAEWTALEAANIAGPLNLIRHALPPMLDRGRGRMLFLSSSATERPVALSAAYAASKAAVNAMVATLPLEVGRAEVAFNAFNPGPIDTPTYGRVTRALHQGAEARALAQPAERAAALPLWLCAPDTHGVTGEFVQWRDPDVMPLLREFGARMQLPGFA